MERKCALKVLVAMFLLTLQYVLFYGQLATPTTEVGKDVTETTNKSPVITSLMKKMASHNSNTTALQKIETNPMLTPQQQRKLEAALKKAAGETKYILDWYGKEKTRSKPWPSHVCGSCELTSDRTLINHPNTGAVVFIYKKFNLTTTPRSPRRKDQLYVWYTAEAPSSLYTMRKLNLVHEDRYQFNLTQTYRRDSGIYHPYGDMEEILSGKWESGENKNISKILEQKTKVAVAVISNCNATPGAKVRIEIIEKMKQLGLEVETYGRCFDKNITETHHELEGVLGKYKFYLAFENAYHCRDYITEKFFINGFRSGSVPVAWGATKEEYEAVAPEKSFIFAEDFASVGSLVSYLKYLNANDEAYLEYFKWIQKGASSLPVFGRIIRFCQLCRQIHGINVDDIYHPSYNASKPERPLFTETIAERKVDGLKKWYYYTESKECLEKDPDRIKRLVKFIDFK